MNTMQKITLAAALTLLALMLLITGAAFASADAGNGYATMDEFPDPTPWNLDPPPDRDNDRLFDMHDVCPDTPGAIEWRGCPDEASYNDAMGG